MKSCESSLDLPSSINSPVSYVSMLMRIVAWGWPGGLANSRPVSPESASATRRIIVRACDIPPMFLYVMKSESRFSSEPSAPTVN